MNKKNKYNKKAWLRIVEAFVSVMLVMSVVFIINVQNRPVANPAEEIGKLQRYTLDYVMNDNLLRGQVLGGYLGGVNDKIIPILPAGYSYLIKTCPYNLTYNDICSLGFIVPGEVYSDETLLFANLTYYNPESAVKLKLFFWPGDYPEGFSAPDYYINKPAGCSDDCSQLGNKKCFNSTSYQECKDTNSDGCFEWAGDKACSASTPICEINTGNCVTQQATIAEIYVSRWTTSAPYNWVNPATGITNKRIDWGITISNKNNVNFFINNFTECFRIKPVDWTNNCKITQAPLNLIVNSYTNFTKDSGSYTTDIPNIYNLTYSGIDLNGHDFSVFRQIAFP